MTELEKLQTLVKKQQEELAEKDQIIKKQNIQIENLMQALLHAKKKLFGPSTEVTKQEDGQLSLFETLPELAEELKKEQHKITVKTYARTARQPGVRAEMLDGLTQVVEEYTIPQTDRCQICGGELKVIGTRLIRTEVEFIPAKLIVKQVLQQVAKCTQCGTQGSENPNCHFQKAMIPNPALAHSLSTPSLIAQIMYQKFCMGLPFARQEKDWYRIGLSLSRANMANWVIRCCEEWFLPLYHKILEQLVTCQVLHMDETRIQCNKEEGKKASSQSYLWVIRSAECEETTAAFFYYSRSRSGDIAKTLLSGFCGYLITDAYKGYDKVADIKRALCWSHVRRYYIESIPLDNTGKEIPGSRGAKGREFINRLFKVEEKIRDLTNEDRKQKRQEASQPILDAFWSWVEETAALKTTNEPLTKALNYSMNQRAYLETFLMDGRVPISNNLCEANIRPYATARRAWLFADTKKGAKANAILYTLVESARANGLDVYEYLKYLLSEMPNNQHLERPEILSNYLPWSKQLPEECQLKKQKKCFKK